MADEAEVVGVDQRACEVPVLAARGNALGNTGRAANDDARRG